MTSPKKTAQGIVNGAVRFPASDEPDHHRNAPAPDPVCLYGLIGEVARAGSENTEANPYAIALNFLAYLCAAIGRGAYTYVGNTRHHARLFTLHVGRSGRGRKGDAASLVHRIDMAVRAAGECTAPQVHSGGLSTREGLALMIHDGWTMGKKVVQPIHDKRLWVIESEFANVLHQGKRDGNTLSTALRDAWDGVSIKPATKGHPRVWASDPHICLSGAVTPGELHGLIEARDLTNGFANRFLVIWAERTTMVPFPKATSQAEVDALAERVAEVIRFTGGDGCAKTDVHDITMNQAAQALFSELYSTELNDQSGGEKVSTLLERRAPVLRRLSMLFALCDLKKEVDVRHVEAALGWIRYWTDSVKFIFSDAASEVATAETNATAQKILDFLEMRNRATRSELSKDCFGGHQTKAVLDAALDELLSSSPPRVVVKTVPRPKGAPGSPTKYYLLAVKSAKTAKCEDLRGLQRDPGLGVTGETGETGEFSKSANCPMRTQKFLDKVR
jgi:hypothetical protein